MGQWWKDELTRRNLLRLGVTSAVLAAMPWTLARRAAATTADPHLVVTFFGDGGWDPTQTLEGHDPADVTDGIDVDVPGQPPSALRTVGAVTYTSNPVTRPAVDTFFDNWAGRTAIINGISTRSTSHDQSRQLVLTGYLDPTRADFAVMAAHHNGADLPLPHLLLSGPSFGGPFSGLSGRVGGQLGNALAYTRIPSHTPPGDGTQLAVSAVGEAQIQRALEFQRLLDEDAGGAIVGRYASFADAQRRGDKLARLAQSLPQNTNNGAQLAAAVAQAFRQGLTTSVTVNNVGGFDTHSDNTQQNGPWMNVFQFLDGFVTGLSQTAGIVAPSALDETTIIYCSEFGRTPQLNDQQGKDHHPWTSMLVLGKGVRPGVYGATDGNQEGVKTNLATGLPDAAGQVIDVTNVVAGLLVLTGANAGDYLPAGVVPLTAMVA